MRPVNRFFVVIVVVSLLAGGIGANSFGSELRATEIISVVESQIDSEVTELRVTDGELLVTVEVSNPTGYPIQLEGTFVRVFRGDPTQLAYGAGHRLDDGPERVPPRGNLVARYSVGLNSEQADRLRTAFESGPVRLTVFHAMSLRGKSFTVIRPNVTVTGEVEG